MSNPDRGELKVTTFFFILLELVLTRIFTGEVRVYLWVLTSFGAVLHNIFNTQFKMGYFGLPPGVVSSSMQSNQNNEHQNAQQVK